MDATTISVQDFANMIIVAGFAGFIGLTFGALIGQGVVVIAKKIAEHRKQKKAKEVTE